MDKIQIDKPEYYRLGQAIYNVISKNISNTDKKLLAESPIAYDQMVVDNKARIADAIFNISDTLLIQLLDGHYREDKSNGGGGAIKSTSD